MKFSKLDIYMFTTFHIVLIISIIGIILLLGIVKSLKEVKKDIDYLIKDVEVSEILMQIDTLNIEELVLEAIMLHEGFRSEPYKDIAGNLTIGYGHKIKKGENFKKISKDEGYAILKDDFNQAMEAALRLSPHLKHPNNIFKRYTIAHFIFGKGSGSYARSTLRKKVNNCENVDDEFRRWVYATVDKKKVKLTNLEKIAEWRIKLYNKQI